MNIYRDSVHMGTSQMLWLRERLLQAVKLCWKKETKHADIKHTHTDAHVLKKKESALKSDRFIDIKPGSIQ